MKIANCFSASLPTLRSVRQGVSLINANKSQTYAILATRDTNHFQNWLRDRLHKIFHWMTDTTLKLNASKSEFVIIGRVNVACLFESIWCAQYVEIRFLMCQSLDCM